MRTKPPRIDRNTGWSRLTDFKEECIYRGTLLRLPGGFPYESFVDFMVIDLPGNMALLVASGYKAGLIRQILPDEALMSDARAISPSWLIENWEKWVGQGSVQHAWICTDIPAPQSLPG